MNTPTPQVQLKISLSEQLNNLLSSRAARLGVPVTQFVKHLIVKEVAEEEYPTFEMSKRSEQNLKKAIIQRDKAVSAKDFFKRLNNE